MPKNFTEFDHVLLGLSLQELGALEILRKRLGRLGPEDVELLTEGTLTRRAPAGSASKASVMVETFDRRVSMCCQVNAVPPVVTVLEDQRGEQPTGDALPRQKVAVHTARG